MFSVEKFEDYLKGNGFQYKDNGRSIILQVCPDCGCSSYKVWFSQDMPDSNDRLLGKCFKCGKGWSSISYLLESEMDKKEVLDLHGINRTADENETFSLEKLELCAKPVVDSTKMVYFTLDGLIPMSECLNTYHAKYAIKRGVPPELYSKVYVDLKAGAIVFPVIEDGKVAGYQKRLIAPGDPSRKAHTPVGFEKGKHILEYENIGHILVVEGPLTAVSGFVFGFHSACTFGAGVSSVQLDMIEKIARKTGKKVAIGYDTDKAGLVGYYRIKNTLERKGIETYRVLPEVGSDLNDSWMAGKGYKIETIDDSIDTSVPFLGLLEL